MACVTAHEDEEDNYHILARHENEEHIGQAETYTRSVSEGRPFDLEKEKHNLQQTNQQIPPTMNDERDKTVTVLENARIYLCSYERR